MARENANRRELAAAERFFFANAANPPIGSSPLSKTTTNVRSSSW
jgi:hypothetical protein